MKPKFYTPPKFDWSGPHDGLGGDPRWCCMHKALNGLDVTEHKVGTMSVTFRSNQLQDLFGDKTGGSLLLNGEQFDNKDELAGFALRLVRWHAAAVKNVPVPPQVKELVDRIRRELNLQAQKLRDQCVYHQILVETVDRVLPVVGLEPYDEGPGSEAEKLLRKLDAFVLPCDPPKSPPFFSETRLYELLGKTDARDVLSIIAQVKRQLDPVKGAL